MEFYQAEDEEQPTTSPVPTTGMKMVQDAVTFTNGQVLKPDAKPIVGTAKMMADQAAAMLIEDVRSYLQGNEQVLSVAMAQAMALVLAGDPAGEKAVKVIVEMQNGLSAFVGEIGTAAKTISGEFI